MDNHKKEGGDVPPKHVSKHTEANVEHSPLRRLLSLWVSANDGKPLFKKWFTLACLK